MRGIPAPGSHSEEGTIHYLPAESGLFDPWRWDAKEAFHTNRVHVLVAAEAEAKTVTFDPAPETQSLSFVSIENYGEPLTFHAPQGTAWPEPHVLGKNRGVTVSCSSSPERGANWTWQNEIDIPPEQNALRVEHLDLVPFVPLHASPEADFVEGDFCVTCAWPGTRKVQILRDGNTEPVLSWDLAAGAHVLHYRLRGDNLARLRGKNLRTHTAWLHVRADHTVHWTGATRIDRPVFEKPDGDQV